MMPELKAQTGWHDGGKDNRCFAKVGKCPFGGATGIEGHFPPTNEGKAQLEEYIKNKYDSKQVLKTDNQPKSLYKIGKNGMPIPVGGAEDLKEQHDEKRALQIAEMKKEFNALNFTENIQPIPNDQILRQRGIIPPSNTTGAYAVSNDSTVLFTGNTGTAKERLKFTKMTDYVVRKSANNLREPLIIIVDDRYIDDKENDDYDVSGKFHHRENGGIIQINNKYAFGDKLEFPEHPDDSNFHMPVEDYYPEALCIIAHEVGHAVYSQNLAQFLRKPLAESSKLHNQGKKLTGIRIALSAMKSALKNQEQAQEVNFKNAASNALWEKHKNNISKYGQTNQLEAEAEIYGQWLLDADDPDISNVVNDYVNLFKWKKAN